MTIAFLSGASAYAAFTQLPAKLIEVSPVNFDTTVDASLIVANFCGSQLTEDLTLSPTLLWHGLVLAFSTTFAIAVYRALPRRMERATHIAIAAHRATPAALKEGSL